MSMHIKGKGVVTGGSTKKKKKAKRAKDDKGKFVADDKSTPDVNEAWEDGKGPEKSED